MSQNKKMDNESLKIEITKNEALVLFEFLSRYSDTDILSIKHAGEKQALLNLACTFEKTLPEPFSSDYKKTLESARQKIQDGS